MPLMYSRWVKHMILAMDYFFYWFSKTEDRLGINIQLYSEKRDRDFEYNINNVQSKNCGILLGTIDLNEKHSFIKKGVNMNIKGRVENLFEEMIMGEHLHWYECNNHFANDHGNKPQILILILRQEGQGKN